MSIFLDTLELKTLTAKTRPGAQRRALDRMGVIYLVRPDGRPIVTRAAVEQLGERNVSEQSPQPNWNAL